LTKTTPARMRDPPEARLGSTLSPSMIHPKRTATIGVMKVKSEILVTSILVKSQYSAMNPNADPTTAR